MEYPLGTLLLAGAVAVVSEYVDSALGMGYGTTVTPLLLLLGFDPLKVVPIVLGSEFATGLLAAKLHHTFGNVSFARGSADRKAALLLGTCGAVGAVAGVELATHVSRSFVSAYIGAVVLATGLVIIATRRWNPRFSWKGIGAVGLVAAFNKGIGGGGYGPLLTGGQILSGVNPRAAIGVTSFAESVVSLVGLVTYFVILRGVDWQLGLPVLAGGLVSAPLSAWTVSKVQLRHLRVLAGIAACLLGLLVLLRLSSP
ncbi:MAG: sulfite exporter TauE/SafE family protein [Myxococcales bacterium]